MWEPFGSCLLNSTANPAQSRWKWTGLAVLFRRQLPNGSLNFFIFSIISLNYSFPQTTINLTSLTHNISDIGVVTNDDNKVPNFFPLQCLDALK